MASLIEWRGVSWSVVRESRASWRLTSEESILEIEGMEGSIWGTPELRLSQYGSSEEPVQNIFCFEGAPFQSFSATVCILPLKHGAQAGILVYVDDMNYIKLVVEGDKNGGTMIILAAQIDGLPSVLAKIEHVENDGSRAFCLSFNLTEDGQMLFASLDGEKILPACNVPSGEGKTIKPALMAHSLGPDNWARLVNFEISPK